MIKEISVKYGYTINMGNYESCRIDMGITKSVEMENEEEATHEMNKIYKKLETEVLQKVDAANS